MAKTYSENLFSLSSGLLPAKVVIFICTINVYHTCPMHCRNLAEIMSEPKKLTGIQKPLDISTALAKIIGTKKGEQVLSASTCRVLANCLLIVFSTGFTTASGEEVVGVLEGEGSSGDF